MGGDGGSIPGRDVLAKTKKAKRTASQVTFGRCCILNWTHCSLTKEMLQEPICCDDLGNLYNKASLIQAMIDKTLPKALCYIRKIKRDVIDCKVTLRDNLAESVNINDEENGGLFHCPISGLVGNGKHPFVCLRKCGCVISQRALNNVKGQKCLICDQVLSTTVDSYTRVAINPGAEQQEALFKQMMERKQHAKLEKIKQKTKKKIESASDGAVARTVASSSKNKKRKKVKEKRINDLLEAQKKETRKESVSGHKRVLSQAEESVSKRLKTSHVFASIFNRKQRDFNFAGGGTGF